MKKILFILLFCSLVCSAAIFGPTKLQINETDFSFDTFTVASINQHNCPCVFTQKNRTIFAQCEEIPNCSLTLFSPQNNTVIRYNMVLQAMTSNQEKGKIATYIIYVSLTLLLVVSITSCVLLRKKILLFLIKSARRQIRR